ncbi:unnamed protein product [Linum trigynum]|uniref:Disease resistance protein RGA3 n=1 Tax=Linum trigynum TaxID=586398 RepID=A0AAV2DI06_9ROSI
MAAALGELVLKKLGSLAADQASLLWGLKSEIQRLESTVSSIQAVLLDAEEQSSKSHQVQLWLRGLEEALYDAEDLLDDFSTEVLQRKQMDGNGFVNEVCRFFSPSNQVAYGLKIANQIKAIRSKLDEIDQNRKQFNFQTCPVASQHERQTESTIPEIVVGREEDKQEIISMLLSPSYKEKVAVVPIVGMGGLGKTTLAQLIYNDDKIKSRFDCRSWVCVSETFEPKVLVKSILESMTKKKVEDLPLNVLKDLLHEEINNKLVLLVLDDVWNEDREKWIRFKGLFTSAAAEGSRMVITTRLRIVAEMIATETIVPHELKGLSEPESWSLFEKMAFKGGVASGRRYVELGKEVVMKCRGVPLALRSMGGVLFFKDTESEWETVRDRHLLSLEGDILATTLKLSYDNLPSHLKRCFAYCKLFPKDHEIEVKMLIQLWMAQGYVTKSNQSSVLEEVGMEHFKNLLWRSFFQEVTKDAYGNMKSCKMHDLMHDLAVSIAGEETICLNASNLTNSLLSSGNINLERIRHLSIDFGERSFDELWQVPTLLAKATRLRTFLIINVIYKAKFEGGCEKIFPKMIRLRVLGLRKVTTRILTSTVHELKHLRYLDFSENEMEVLSNEISRLVNLQVFNLRGCVYLSLLPTKIEKLHNLIYLDLDDSSLTGVPAGIGNLSFLRELTKFVVTEAAADGTSPAAGLGELKKLNNLSGELTIKGLEWVKDKSEAETANLNEKSRLRRLQLWWGDARIFKASDDDMARRSDLDWSVLEALQPHSNLKEIRLSFYCGTSIPTRNCWFSSLRNLVQIKLYGCRKLRSLPNLVPFVSLEELELQGLCSLEYVQSETMTPNNDLEFLPSLKCLAITFCRNLVGWSPKNTEDSPLLPRVSTLEITYCPKIVLLPRFRVNFERVELTAVSSDLLSAFGASLISPPRSRFHWLCLESVNELPQRLVAQLTSLKRLRIYHTTLSPSILRQLPSLQEFHIRDCKFLELDDYYYDDCDDDHNNMAPPCVLPSLRCLIVDRDELVTLPKWVQHSSNLQQLEIIRCDELKCLPSWLTKLTALKSLNVRRCGILSGRCRSNTAEDWPIVSHIPNIEVDFIVVQQNGCYLGIDEELHQQQQHQQEEEASSHTLISSSLLQNCFASMTCNLFQRCFLP